MSNFFKGWYHKLQNGQATLALIPSYAKDGAFIQVITDDQSYNVPYPLTQLRERKNGVSIGTSYFSPQGCQLALETTSLRIDGNLQYQNLTPLKYDIMGFFKYLPMECRHGIISMRHQLQGQLELNGQVYNFDGGAGYLEMDSGRSFPRHYSWLQCNDFREPHSIMVSIAHIPLGPIFFRGCICVVHYRGREYRLATYKGVKIDCCEEGKIRLTQGQYRLAIDIPHYQGRTLYAPQNGVMIRNVHECTACRAHFRFYQRGTLLFEETSDRASYEYVPLPR